MKRFAAGLAAAVWLAGCAPQPATSTGQAVNSGSASDTTPYKIDYEIKDVMDHVIDFASDSIWDKQGSYVDAKGEHSLAPTTDAEWTAIEHHAVTLAEAANLLMLPGRAVDNDRWIKQAAKLHDSAIAEYKAIKARDTEKMFQVGSEMYVVCRDCHAMYILGEEPPK